MEPSLCRFCHAECAVEVEVVDGRAVRVIGMRDNPAYHGFTCAKGRELPNLQASPRRLLHSQARTAEGTYAAIPVERAMDEIATRLRSIVDRHGPESIALYIGTHGYNSFLTGQTAMAFMQSIGSPMVFTSVTIDQPGKAVSTALHGTWLAGPPSIEQADVWLATGTNPPHSMLGPVNPGRAFTDAKARGMKLVVIDPRRTELARRADVHLQARPGEDPTVLAGLIRVIFAEELLDRAFVDANVQGLERLRAAVDAYDPEYVARRADVPTALLSRAARIYAAGARGVAVVGTGPNMSGHGNLTEYLSKVLMTICGHWLREGDVVPNPGVFIQWPPHKAQAIGPSAAWGFGPRLRVRGLGNTVAGLPTAALADEMLLDGKGQVKALFNLGGNPLLAWPDQLKTHDALRRLELLVSVDPALSATARLSHYVIAPKLFFETTGTSALAELLGAFVGWGFTLPYGQYAEKLVEPPEGADVIDDWELFYGLARRLGVPLAVGPVSHLDPATQAAKATQLDMERRPSTEELWEILLRDSPVPLEEVKRHPRGHVFSRPVSVEPKEADHAGHLEVGDAAMMRELAEIRQESFRSKDAGFAFRLISRRLPDIHNSSWHDNERLRRRHVSNPAFLHPADLRDLGVEPGRVVEISSARATILGVVEADPDLRRGVLSMPHCWGEAPGEGEDVYLHGGNTGRLSSSDSDYDPHTGIPCMSTIPVNVRPARVRRADERR